MRREPSFHRRVSAFRRISCPYGSPVTSLPTWAQDAPANERHGWAGRLAAGSPHGLESGFYQAQLTKVAHLLAAPPQREIYSVGVQTTAI